MDSHLVVKSEDLRSFLTRAFTKVGLAKPQTDAVVDLLVVTSLRGVDTHGLSLAERYLEGVKHGNINSRPKLKVLKDRPSTATIDADRGLGAFVATKATELAIKKAKRTGIGAVSLINLTHCGALSYYGLLVTKQKMAAVAFTNSSKIAPPWGGSSRVFGTNPICYTFPSSSGEVVLDIATTQGAGRKVEIAKRDGKQIPMGWALDRMGHPTTDPEEAMNGVLLPFGGHKGYGLMFASEFYSAILGGGVMSYDGGDRYYQGGFFIQAIDIGAFRDYSGYLDDMKKVAKRVRASKVADGFDRIYLPGEPEILTMAKRRKEGIPVDAESWSYFEKAAKELGIAPLQRI